MQNRIHAWIWAEHWEIKVSVLKEFTTMTTTQSEGVTAEEHSEERAQHKPGPAEFMEGFLQEEALELLFEAGM